MFNTRDFAIGLVSTFVGMFITLLWILPEQDEAHIHSFKLGQQSAYAVNNSMREMGVGEWCDYILLKLEETPIKEADKSIIEK